jgi:hypothetical protein
MIDDEQIRGLVAALARPHRSGGDVIERAAILEWIAAKDRA